MKRLKTLLLVGIVLLVGAVVGFSIINISESVNAEVLAAGDISIDTGSEYEVVERVGNNFRLSFQYSYETTRFPDIAISDESGGSYYLFLESQEKKLEDIDISLTADTVAKEYSFVVCNDSDNSKVVDCTVTVEIQPIVVANLRSSNSSVVLSTEYGVAPEYSFRSDSYHLPKGAYTLKYYSYYNISNLAAVRSEVFELSKITSTNNDRYVVEVLSSETDGRFDIRSTVESDEIETVANCFYLTVSKNTSTLNAEEQYIIDYSLEADNVQLTDKVVLQSNFSYHFVNTNNNKTYVTLQDILSDTDADYGYKKQIGEYAGSVEGIVAEYVDADKFETPQSEAMTILVKRLAFTMKSTDFTVQYTGSELPDSLLLEKLIIDTNGVQNIKYTFFSDELGNSPIARSSVVEVKTYYYKAYTEATDSVIAVSSNISKITIEKAQAIIYVNGQNRQGYVDNYSSASPYDIQLTFNATGLGKENCTIVYTKEGEGTIDGVPNENGRYTVAITITDSDYYTGSYEYTLVINAVYASDFIQFSATGMEYDNIDNCFTAIYNRQSKTIVASVVNSAPAPISQYGRPSVRYYTTASDFTTTAPSAVGTYTVKAFFAEEPNSVKETTLVINKVNIIVRIRNQVITYGQQLPSFENKTNFYETTSNLVMGDNLTNVLAPLPNVIITETGNALLTRDMTDSYTLSASGINEAQHEYYSYTLDNSSPSTLTINAARLTLSFTTCESSIEEIASLNAANIIRYSGAFQGVASIDELFPDGLTLNYVPLGSAVVRGNYQSEIYGGGTYIMVLSPETEDSVVGKYSIEYYNTETDGVLYIDTSSVSSKGVSISGAFHPKTSLTVIMPNSRSDIEKTKSGAVSSDLTAVGVYQLTVLEYNSVAKVGQYTIALPLPADVEFDASSIQLVTRYANGREETIPCSVSSGSVVFTVTVGDGEALRTTLADSYVIFAKVKQNYTLIIIIGAAIALVLGGGLIALFVILGKRKKAMKEAKQAVKQEIEEHGTQTIAVATAKTVRSRGEFDDEDVDNLEYNAPIAKKVEEDKYAGMTEEEIEIEKKKEKLLEQRKKQEEEVRKATLSAIAKEEEERQKREEQERIAAEQRAEEEERQRLWDEKWNAMTPEEQEAYNAEQERKKEEELRAIEEEKARQEEERKKQIAEKEELSQAMFQTLTKKTDEEIAREKAKEEMEKATSRLRKKNRHSDDNIEAEGLAVEIPLDEKQTSTVSREKSDKVKPSENKKQAEEEKHGNEVNSEQIKPMVAHVATPSRRKEDDFDMEFDTSYAGVLKNQIYPKARTISYQEAVSMYPKRKLEQLPDGSVASAPMFAVEINLASNEQKYIYSEVKNRFMSYGFTQVFGKRYETFLVADKQVVRLVFLDGILHLAFKTTDEALVEGLDIVNMSKDRKYSEMPLCYRIDSGDAITKALELIGKLAAIEGLTMAKALNVNYIDRYPFIEKLFIDEKRRV